MGVPRQARCHRYSSAAGCRGTATNSLRRGDHVYRYCDNPACDPRTAEDHYVAIEGWITEAAADLAMDEDIVWHDVAVSYIQLEVHDDNMKRELCRRWGIDPVVLAH